DRRAATRCRPARAAAARGRVPGERPQRPAGAAVNGLAALCTAVATYLLLAWMGGRLPRLGRRRARATGGPRARLRRWLAEADVALSPGAYIAACAALTLLVLSVMTALTATPVVALAP